MSGCLGGVQQVQGAICALAKQQQKSFMFVSSPDLLVSLYLIAVRTF